MNSVQAIPYKWAEPQPALCRPEPAQPGEGPHRWHARVDKTSPTALARSLTVLRRFGMIALQGCPEVAPSWHSDHPGPRGILFRKSGGFPAGLGRSENVSRRDQLAQLTDNSGQDLEHFVELGLGVETPEGKTNAAPGAFVAEMHCPQNMGRLDRAGCAGGA